VNNPAAVPKGDAIALLDVLNLDKPRKNELKIRVTA
jgi:hypothetical protein